MWEALKGSESGKQLYELVTLPFKITRRSLSGVDDVLTYVSDKYNVLRPEQIRALKIFIKDIVAPEELFEVEELLDIEDSSSIPEQYTFTDSQENFLRCYNRNIDTTGYSTF